MHDTQLPIGARVRLRQAHDFLTLRTAEATVLGPGTSPGLVLIRLDEPARCQFEPEDQHDVQEIAEAIENLDLM